MSEQPVDPTSETRMPNLDESTPSGWRLRHYDLGTHVLTRVYRPDGVMLAEWIWQQ